ncbi:unnamed protein product, partial [Rotaria sordida]
MSSDNKEPKRGSIQSFFRSSFKKKKVDTSTSAVDQSAQTPQPDETACSSSDKTSKSLPSSSQVPSLSSSSISSPPPPLSIQTLPPLSISLISSPTQYSPSISSPPQCSSISSPTECSSSTSPSQCSLFISSPKQRSPSISFSLLSLSSTMAVAMEKSVTPSDISHSSTELPTQPKLSSYPMNKHNRSFRSIWYSTFPWLEYSIKQDVAFCYYCRHFSDASNLLNRYQSDAFITGYNNWKNAIAKNHGFSRHETSVSHKYACSNYQQFILRTSTETTVLNVIDKGRIELIRKNRQRLTKIASTILLCSRQLISLRGHDENDMSNNRGNFIEILKWSSTTDPLVNSILVDSADNASYLSPLVQNELIHLMANQIRKQIVEKVDGHVFALMADEAKDCSLIISLQELENEGDGRSVDARGLLVALQVPIFIITLFIIHKIFGIIKILSDQLKAKTMDFYKAQYLIKCVITKIADLHDEHAFSLIYTQITSFCEEHHIDLSSTPRLRRIKTISSRFKNVFVFSTIGQRDNLNNENNYRINLFYPIVDAVLIELNDRFSDHNLEILIGISALCPDNENFLQTEILKPFAAQMKADFCSLCNEIQVVKSMLKDSKLENIVDLYYQLLPLKQAFPTIISLIVAAMTMPVSSTTCERTFKEEIDGIMLARLPFDELRALFSKLKDRVLFTEKRDILIKEWNNTANEQLDGTNTLNECSKQTFDICSASQIIASTQDLLNDTPLFCNDMNNGTSGTTSNIDSQINEDENDDLEESQQNLPLDFAFISLPEDIQLIIDENEYPKASDYFLITQALLKALKIPTTDANAANEWREAIKQKFKNERRLLQKIPPVVQRKKEKFGKGCGRSATKSQALSAERKYEKMIYVSSIMDECDIEQLVTTMKEGTQNGTIHNDVLSTLWKKTFGYRRLFIRSHTTNEVLEKFPGYSYPCLIFEEIKMIDNVDIEQNVSEILPRLFDKLSNNTLFIMGEFVANSNIKLLCKQFKQSISHILIDNEPVVPTPCIKLSNEKFQLYLDWQVVVETTSPTTALSLLLSLYNVFEVKFAKNNHTSHLLYGVFFQNGDELGKNLRIILNSWYFTFEDRTKKSQTQTTNSIDYVYIQTAQQLQVHSTATTTESVYSSTTTNTGENESPQSSQSIPLKIADQEQQPHDNSLIQIHESEQMDVGIKTASSPAVHSGIEQIADTKRKFSNSSNIQHKVLKDAINSEASTATTKGEKRKLPSSPKQQKLSSRLAAKR